MVNNEVWYDAPAAPGSVNCVPDDDQSELMTIQSHLAGHPVNTLFDGGAMHKFVSVAHLLLQKAGKSIPGLNKFVRAASVLQKACKSMLVLGKC